MQDDVQEDGGHTKYQVLNNRNCATVAQAVDVIDRYEAIIGDGCDKKRAVRLVVGHTTPPEKQTVNFDKTLKDLIERLEKLEYFHYGMELKNITLFDMVGNFKRKTEKSTTPQDVMLRAVQQICEELVGDIQNVNSSFRRRVSDETSEKRLNRDAHHDCERPAHATTNQRCKVCREKYLRAKSTNPQANASQLPKRHKTTIWCRYCKEFLCVGKVGDNCWYDWHNRVQYWR
ncbi:hypothetical protein LOTGIDRAFT_155095 [Lottia gigantea]|uniref:Uncharacterized protein n=1 Tax=Lottia gigantea TaxID=225164 RepID=V3ZMR6_LOTGI|nr:hypothetical protein LOTGIDRAFT_155095 [Lottia gigantea]ESO85607.1 hypothetical protein LOTGIDRAFT_155095 [Lottia gigantea]